MKEDKYFKIARKYLDLTEIYYNEYNNKNDSEVIFENNFKFEIALSAYGFYFSYGLNGFDQNTALFGRKIIEDYYLYKLKDTKYLTHSNFKLFKIASYKAEVGTRALHEISDEFRLPVNIIKKRMFDNDFWSYPMRLNSFEHLFELDYEGKIKDKTNNLLKKLYKAYGIYLHYTSTPDTSLNEFNSSLAIINQIVREVIEKDYDKVRVKKECNDDNDLLLEEFNNIIINISKKQGELRELYVDENHFFKEKMNDFATYQNLISNLERYLYIYFIFYISNKRALGVYLNKVFIEELAYFYTLIEKQNFEDIDRIFLLSNYMTNKLVGSILNENVNLEDSLKFSKTFIRLYNRYNLSQDGIDEFISKYKDSPYKLINDKYDTFTSFVNHFIKNFNKKAELNYIYKEACSIGHSYGLIQNHEFNYKKTFAMLLDVIENYLNYYSCVFVTRNFKSVEKRNERDALNQKVNEISGEFIKVFNFLKEKLNLL